MKHLLEPNTTLYPVPVMLVTCGGERPIPRRWMTCVSLCVH